MDKKEQAYTLYQKGWKYADIAEHLDVSLSAVKTWASRYWNVDKSATKSRKKVATKSQKVATKSQKVATKTDKSKAHNKTVNKRGAPIGNVNAVGNSGGGAMPGNQNSLKHGGYSKLLFSTFTEDKLQALGDTVDEESVLVEEIQLLTLRESYLLERIAKYSASSNDEANGKKAPLSVSGMVSTTDKRDFTRLDKDPEKAAADRAAYIDAIDCKVEAGDRLPGNANHVTTTTEANYIITERLEKLLTDVQKQKAKCVAQLNEVRSGKDVEGNIIVEGWIRAGQEIDEE